MKAVRIILILGCILFTCMPVNAQDNAFTGTDRIIIYFFWGDGCPHCLQEKPFLEEVAKEYPQLEIRAYEVWHNKENAALFAKMTKAYAIRNVGVPATFIDDKAFIGFSGAISEQLLNEIDYCVRHGCGDPAAILSPRPIKQGDETITLPFFGKVDPSGMSLPVFTIILGGLDSFNPCAFFVLFFLLSLLIHARSKKRMLLIGGTFIFFSGFIYFIFMAAWLNFFLLTGQLAIITTIAGGVSIIIAGINIKDFFFFRKGVSLSISEKAKPKLFERMRDLLKSTSVPSMLAGTIVLAIAANSYELLCTAGFPMVFTRVLTLHNLTLLQYYLYLVLYNIVYVIPLTVIVLVFTITLGARKLTEWQGRKLKLISGVMMLGLGAVLLINPALLNNVLMSAGLLAVSLVISGIIIVLTREKRP